MDASLGTVAIDLAAALAAGALVGAERSFNGRAAGLRTHAIVALAAAGAMMISWGVQLSPGMFPGPYRLDPTRIGQGLMTGVGFLGAGVIFKEGVSVQGLTTAASIWATASIGMLCGLGLLAPAGLVTVGVLVALVLMRWLEDVLPHRVYALASFTFETAAAPSEAELEVLLDRTAIRIRDVSYQLLDDGRRFQYRANLASLTEAAFQNLSAHLKGVPGLIGFDLARLGR